MYDNWLIFPPFLFPPNIRREGKKEENKLAKPGSKEFFFNNPFDFHLFTKLICINK